MQTLIKVWGVSGAILIPAYLFYRYKVESPSDLKNVYLKESLELLKGYKPAVDKLGAPLKLEKFDQSDSFNEITEKNVKAKCLVKGDRREADLFVYASRSDTDVTWNINSLEIKYHGSPNKYKIFDRSLIDQKINNTAEKK